MTSATDTSTSIVALHGAFGAPGDWDEVWQAGAFQAPPSCPWLPGHDPAARAADVSTVDLMDSEMSIWELALDRLSAALPDGPLHLVGYSMGGRLALGLALRPAVRARLRRLTLLSTSAGIDDERARAARAAVDDERAASLCRDPGAFLEEFWSLPVFASLTGRDDLQARLARRAALAATHTAVLARWMKGLSVGRQPSYWSALSGLADVAVDVVVGERDERYVAHGARIAAALPRARITTVGGAGHSLLIEAPAAVAAVVAAVETDVAADAVADIVATDDTINARTSTTS